MGRLRKSKGGGDCGASSYLSKAKGNNFKREIFTYMPPDEISSIGRFYLNNHWFANDDDSPRAKLARKKLGEKN